MPVQNPTLWIASLKRIRPTSLPAHASGARFVVARPARKPNGHAPADMCGTLSILVAFAQRAFTSGLKPNASPVSDGRATRTGMLIDLIKIKP